MEARLIHARGRVQGVGLRWFCTTLASELAITGFAKNLDDGSIEIWIEGPVASLDSFVSRLQHGNGFSQIDHLLVSHEQLKHYSRFSYY